MRTMLLALAVTWLSACDPIEPNYLEPDWPRRVEDHATTEPEPDGDLLVVSYNLFQGRDVPAAIAALRDGPLAGADLVLMQEMEDEGVDDIASVLGLRYVYYPASVKAGRDWGNAVLSRWPLVEYHKVLLPHADPYSDSRRIATRATVDIGGRMLLVYSTHIATPSLGLGARLDQVEAIADDAGDELPAVIGGDFNTADPGSSGQTLELLRVRDFAWASDRATDTGTAFGLRDATLDYVFARGLAAGASGTFRGDAGSDHRPIWVELAAP